MGGSAVSRQRGTERGAGGGADLLRILGRLGLEEIVCRTRKSLVPSRDGKDRNELRDGVRSPEARGGRPTAQPCVVPAAAPGAIESDESGRISMDQSGLHNLACRRAFLRQGVSALGMLGLNSLLGAEGVGSPSRGVVNP